MPDGDLAEAKRLLYAARVLAQCNQATVQEAFARLHREWDIIREQRRKLAPRHNLIRFLGFERSEVAFHSPFLCDLLDPYGSHDQGTLFLRSFLELLSDRAKQSGVCWAYQWREPRVAAGSWLALPERGRIDISIRNRDEGVLIFIENKINAAEQKRQLCRYRKRLDSERRHYWHRLLVFLSPKAYGRPQTGKPDIHLTYEEEIVRWLKSIDGEIPASAVTLHSNLQQYRQIIADFRNRTMPNQDLVDLIVRPENFPLAFDIEQAMEDAKAKLLRRFWRSVARVLETRIVELKLSGSFNVDGFRRLERDPRANGAGVYLVENNILPERAHLQIGVFNEGPATFPGIRFSREQTRLHPLQEVHAVCQALPEDLRGLSNWWVGWDRVVYGMDPRDFLCKIATDADTIAESITEDL